MLCTVPSVEAAVPIAAQLVWAQTHGNEAPPDHRIVSSSALVDFRFSQHTRQRTAKEYRLVMDEELPDYFAAEEPQRIDQDLIQNVHALWRARAKVETTLLQRYPHMHLIFEWQSRAPMVARAFTGDGGVIPQAVSGMRGSWRAAENYAGTLDLGGASFVFVPKVAESASIPVAASEEDKSVNRAGLLDIYDRPSRKRRRAMSLVCALAHEAILSMGPDSRAWTSTPVHISISRSELRERMWPGVRRRPRELAALARALPQVRERGVYLQVDPLTREAQRRCLIDVSDDGDSIDFFIHLPTNCTAGAWVHTPTLRLLRCESALVSRAYLTAAEWWDRYITKNGNLENPTIPKMKRDADGQLLNRKGKALLDANGMPEKRWTKGVPDLDEEGNPTRERNPRMDLLPPLARDDIIRMTHTHVSDNPATRRQQYRRAVAALEQLAAPKYARDKKTRLRDAVVILDRDGKGRVTRVLPTEWLVSARPQKPRKQRNARTAGYSKR